MGHDHDHGSSGYAAPSAPAQAYGSPAAPAVDAYGAPAASPVSYDAPTSAYGAPSAEYGAPSSDYGAPSAEYGAPSDAYGAPQQYNEATGYESYDATAEDSQLFDLSNLSAYIPFLLAVFAAIIVAQIFGPLLGTLFGAKMGLAQSLLEPVNQVKIDIANTLLAPFDLVIGDIDTCTAATGRTLGGNFNMSPDKVLSMIYKATEIYNE